MTISVPTSEGTVPFIVAEETFLTWYKVVGDLSNRTKRPLIVLHGGPGLSYDYLIPLADLAPTRSVIFYDQIGSGRSSHAADKPRSFWTIDLMINELVNLLLNLGIGDEFDVIGHSWGGILAAEYILRRSPPGIKNVVFSNSLSSMKLWMESRAAQVKRFPQWIQDGMNAGYDDIPRLRVAAKVVFAEHGCRLNPQPPEYWYSLDQSLENNHVWSNFIGGELKEWTVIDQLHKIGVPSLIINGRYDPAQDFVIAPFLAHIPSVKLAHFEKSSHTPFWEERQRYMQIVEVFLDS